MCEGAHEHLAIVTLSNALSFLATSWTTISLTEAAVSPQYPYFWPQCAIASLLTISRHANWQHIFGDLARVENLEVLHLLW